MFLIEIISWFEPGVLSLFQFKLEPISSGSDFSHSGSGSDLSPILAPTPTKKAWASWLRPQYPGN